jgi:hypothetical protein
MSAPMSIDRLIEDLRAGLEGLEGLDWELRGIVHLSSGMMAASDAFTEICSPDNIRALLDALAASQEENRRLKETNRKLHRRVQIAEAMHQSVMSMSETWGRPSKAHDEWARGWNADGLLQPGSPYDRGRYDARKAIEALATQPTPDHGAAG